MVWMATVISTTEISSLKENQSKLGSLLFCSSSPSLSWLWKLKFEEICTSYITRKVKQPLKTPQDSSILNLLYFYILLFTRPSSLHVYKCLHTRREAKLHKLEEVSCNWGKTIPNKNCYYAAKLQTKKEVICVIYVFHIYLFNPLRSLGVPVWD